MRDNKFVLPIIILLLLIFMPAAIYGTMQHIEKKKSEIIHEHKEDGMLYFYDQNNQFVGSYTCVTDECDDPESEIDDQNFNYDTGSLTYLGVFAGDFALIKDEGVIKLYNLKLGQSIKSFTGFKSYDTKIAGKYIILKDELDYYGLFDLDTVTFVIPLEEQIIFLGVSRHYLNAEPDELILAAHDSDGFFLIDSSGEKVTSTFNDSIYDYSDSYVICYLPDATYKIFNHNKDEFFPDPDSAIKGYQQAGDYYIIKLSNGQVRVYKDSFQSEPKIYSAENGELDFMVEGDTVYITDVNLNDVDSFSISGDKVQDSQSSEDDLGF